MEKFEDLLKELTEIVNELEKGDLSLDESIKKLSQLMRLKIYLLKNLRNKLI